MDPISYLFSRDLQVCDVQMGGIRHLDILKYKLNNIYLICKIWLSFSNIQNLQYLTLTAMYLIILVVVIQRSSWRTNRNLTLNTVWQLTPESLKLDAVTFDLSLPFTKGIYSAKVRLRPKVSLSNFYGPGVWCCIYQPCDQIHLNVKDVLTPSPNNFWLHKFR